MSCEHGKHLGAAAGSAMHRNHVITHGQANFSSATSNCHSQQTLQSPLCRLSTQVNGTVSHCPRELVTQARMSIYCVYMVTGVALLQLTTSIWSIGAGKLSEVHCVAAQRVLLWMCTAYICIANCPVPCWCVCMYRSCAALSKTCVAVYILSGYIRPSLHACLLSGCTYYVRRKAQSYDIGLQETVRDKVTLYSTPVGDAMPFTTFEAAIGENQILHESRVGSKLAIWVGGTAAGGIRVHLCRPASDTEQDCGNGKDDDCDGFTDMEDPDCHPSTRRMLGLTQRPNSGKQQLPPQNSEELQQPSRGNVAYN